MHHSIHWDHFFPIRLGRAAPVSRGVGQGGHVAVPSTGLIAPSPLQGSSRDDTELRYSSQYEERLDPFSSFSRKVWDSTQCTHTHTNTSPSQICIPQSLLPAPSSAQCIFSLQERQRKYLSLSPWDKATLSMVRCGADPSLPWLWGLGC